MKNLLLSFLAFLLFSCGVKTLNKEQTIIDSTATEVAVVKTDSVSIETKETNFDVETTEIIIEPVDTTKPIEVTNKKGEVTKYKNARLSHKKRTDNTIVIQDKIVSKIVVDSVANEIEVNKVENKKVVYKEQFNWSTFVISFWWLWLLIALAIYLGYKWYKGTTPIALVKSIFTKSNPIT